MSNSDQARDAFAVLLCHCLDKDERKLVMDEINAGGSGRSGSAAGFAGRLLQRNEAIVNKKKQLLLITGSRIKSMNHFRCWNV